MKYMALTHLHIPRPDETPSSEKLTPGDVFEVTGERDKDGVTKGLHLHRMIYRGAIRLIKDEPEEVPAKPKARAKKGTK